MHPSQPQPVRFPARETASSNIVAPGELLQKYRTGANLTQTKLAQAIGLKSLRMVQYWEAGSTLPKAENLKKLIEVFAANQAFTKAGGREEIEHLWATVKETYDQQQPNTNSPTPPYPLVPADWLDGVIREESPAPPSPNPQSAGTTPQLLPYIPKGIPNNLPASPNPFIGRSHEIAELTSCLAENQARLLTLVGPGGTGKTRLALEAARLLVEKTPHHYPDGIWLVELAANTDPYLIPQLVARAVWPEGPIGGDALTALLRHLGNKSLLLVLDNCEHLIEACANLAAVLLANCPHLQVLATSREPLQIAGEFVRPINGMAVPPRKKTVLTGSGSDEFEEAIELFVIRAQALDPGFKLTETNRAGLTQLCQLLDGLPLALELAAARLKGVGLPQLVSRLQRNFGLLGGGNRASAPRHQTVQSLLDWSYRLLQPKEQLLLRRVAVFRGSFDLEAAEAVTTGKWAGEELVEGEVLEVLAQLVNKSLVIAETHDELLQVRYRLLEMVRHYGLEKLEAAGETSFFKLTHALYFLNLSEKAEPGFKGPDQGEWMDRLERENDNLRAVLGWGLDKSMVISGFNALDLEERPATFLAGHENRNSAELALALSGNIWRMWYVRGYYNEGRRWLESALASVPRGGNRRRESKITRAKALRGYGILLNLQNDHTNGQTALEESLTLFQELEMKAEAANVFNDLGALRWTQGEVPRAGELWQQSLTLMREAGHRAGVANQLNNLGAASMLQGDYSKALTFYAESGQIYRQLDDHYGLANSLLNQAEGWRNLQDFKQSVRLNKESLALFRKIKYVTGVSSALNNLATASLDLHDYPNALRWADESYKVAAEIGDTNMCSYALHTTGLVRLQQGEYLNALDFFRQSLSLRRDSGDKTGLSQNLQAIAEAVAYLGNWPDFVRLFEATQTLRKEQGLVYNEVERTALEKLREKAARTLGANRFERLCRESNALTLEEVVNYALNLEPEPAQPFPHTVEELVIEPSLVKEAGLTSREVEVLALLGRGLTNNQMAQHLAISPHTVNRHLTHIYSKLDLTTRTEAVRFALSFM